MDQKNAMHLATMVAYLHNHTSPEDRVSLRNMSAVIDGRVSRLEQLENTKQAPHNPSHQHPPPVDPFGVILGDSIEEFCRNHDPEIRYSGRRTAIDALTSCLAPNGEEYAFHYEVVRYARHGVCIKRVEGTGFKTTAEETDELRRRAGLPPFKRRIRKMH